VWCCCAAEVVQVLKKVEEGILIFEEIWDKVTITFLQHYFEGSLVNYTDRYGVGIFCGPTKLERKI
jgi:hypothetical protein